MEAEITTDIQEQSKAVVATTKVRLTAKEGEQLSENFIKELSNLSIQAAINNFQSTRPFVDSQTLRKQR